MDDDQQILLYRSVVLRPREHSVHKELVFYHRAEWFCLASQHCKKEARISVDDLRILKMLAVQLQRVS